MELFLLYIWMKLGALFVMLLVAAATFLFFAIICLLQHDDYPTKGWWVLSKKWFAASATLVIISAIIPTQNQVAVLVGTHYALELGKSTEGQKIVSLVRAKANLYLDEQLKELVEENKPKEKK
jgi:hypothetical protein